MLHYGKSYWNCNNFFSKKHNVIPSKHDALKEYYTSNELQNREFAPRVLNLQSL